MSVAASVPEREAEGAAPTSSRGMRTVVSAGVTSRTVGMSSKPGDRDVGARDEAGVAHRREGADGHDVVHGEDEVEAAEVASMSVRSPVAAVAGERGADDIVVVESPPVAASPHGIRRRGRRRCADPRRP